MTTLNDAIELRKQGHFEQSRTLLFSLLESLENRGAVYLNIAWSFDNQGLESDALEHYSKALKHKLSAEDKFEAKFGLACTHRCLGHLVEAESLFIELLAEYPAATEVIPFYALCLISLQKKDEALRHLLQLIAVNPPTPAIQAYQTALSGYINVVYPVS